MATSTRLQDWLEMRGIDTSDEAALARIVPWLRITFALCATLIGLGTAFAFTPILWMMVPIAAAGGIFPVHPFDQIYNLGIRRLTKTGPLPRNGPPTRFACGLAAPLLVATALAFDSDLAWLGYAFGATLTSIAALVSITHFCIPSLIFQLLFGDRSLVHRAVFGRR